MPKVGGKNWHRDRDSLLRALRDCEGGKAMHLHQGEIDALAADIRQRIDQLNAKIAQG